MKLNLTRQQKDRLIVGTSAFVTGVGVGYIFAARKRVTTVETTVETTIEEHVEYDIEGTDAIADRAQLALDFARAAEDQMEQQAKEDDLHASVIRHPATLKGQLAASLLQAPPRPQPEPDPEPEMSPYEDDNWDQVAEEQDRGPDAPYTIHLEEWHANETNFDQQDLRYFAGDNVLVDGQDVPIYNFETLVGKLEFGHGSGDPDLVFVRNEKARGEYQITRVHHSFQTEILGIEAEEDAEAEDIRHSRHTVLKFRD